MNKNISQYKIPNELHNLIFSVWNKEVYSGHALFAGNFIQIFDFLNNHDFKDLEVSTLNLDFMESYDSLAAEEWLEWYYSFTSYLIGRKDPALTDTLIRKSVRSYIIEGFSDPVLIGVN